MSAVRIHQYFTLINPHKDRIDCRILSYMISNFLRYGHNIRISSKEMLKYPIANACMRLHAALLPSKCAYKPLPYNGIIGRLWPINIAQQCKPHLQLFVTTLSSGTNIGLLRGYKSATRWHWFDIDWSQIVDTAGFICGFFSDFFYIFVFVGTFVG